MRLSLAPTRRQVWTREQTFQQLAGIALNTLETSKSPTPVSNEFCKKLEMAFIFGASKLERFSNMVKNQKLSRISSYKKIQSLIGKDFIRFTIENNVCICTRSLITQ